MIAISRNFKNANGIYETDFIKIRLLHSIATNVVEYCKEGDVIGVRGRLQNVNNKTIVIAEKIAFLSTKGNMEG